MWLWKPDRTSSPSGSSRIAALPNKLGANARQESQRWSMPGIRERGTISDRLRGGLWIGFQQGGRPSATDSDEAASTIFDSTLMETCGSPRKAGSAVSTMVVSPDGTPGTDYSAIRFIGCAPIPAKDRTMLADSLTSLVRF